MLTRVCFGSSAVSGLRFSNAGRTGEEIRKAISVSQKPAFNFTNDNAKQHSRPWMRKPSGDNARRTRQSRVHEIYEC